MLPVVSIVYTWGGEGVQFSVLYICCRSSSLIVVWWCYATMLRSGAVDCTWSAMVSPSIYRYLAVESRTKWTGAATVTGMNLSCFGFLCNLCLERHGVSRRREYWCRRQTLFIFFTADKRFRLCDWCYRSVVCLSGWCHVHALCSDSGKQKLSTNQIIIIIFPSY